jgi:tripartite-type tricarboxylate transporter receptor subunit TctC
MPWQGRWQDRAGWGRLRAAGGHRMTMRFGRRSAAGAALLLAGGGSGPAQSQEAPWPTRTVRIVVPFTPGGSNDTIARPLAERLQARFGQTFVVENRPGAGSAVGIGVVAQSPADGYSLLVTTSSVTAIGAVQGTSFDATTDLDAVALLAKAPLVILVPTASPFRTLPDLVQAARTRPEEVHFASSGPGSTTHIMTELFNLRAGTRMTHVPYRGTAPALTDLVAGRVQVMFTTIASASGQLRGNLLRILAYGDAGRPDGTPDAPTAREQGVDYVGNIWWGLFGPRGLPPSVRMGLNGAVNTILADPAFARFLTNEGAVPAPLTPERFDAFLREEVATLREVVRAARIRAD